MTAADPPYAANPPPSDGTQPSRHQTLADATARIRVRRNINLPVEHILLVLASILFPLGLALIFLGWYGAAHTGHPYEQTDYLISGGILGLALTAAGGFMYFGYWLSRQLGESRRQHALTLQALRHIQDTMTGATTTAAATNGRGRRSRTALADDPTRQIPVPTLVVTAHGSLMHRPDCPVVAGRPGVRPVRADTAGYGHCTMCDAGGAVALKEPTQ
jgi:hypothetical protein